MKTITIKNVSKSFDTKDLFKEITFTIKLGDRIAVVGENGVGKSTLLKIISGEEEYTSGKVIKERVTIEYIPQEFEGDTSLSILGYMEHVHATPDVFDVLKKFKVVPDSQVEEGYMHELSGGQKRLVEIASVLSRKPMFLCIDEPENHLDMHVREILLQTLSEYSGAVVFVSHDRHFIDGVSTKILTLEDGGAVLSSGKTYEEFLQTKEVDTQRAVARWDSENRNLTKLEDCVRMLKKRTRYGDSQARTYQTKNRELIRRKEELGRRPFEETPVAKISTGDIRQKNGKLILQTDDVSFAYPDSKNLFESLTLDMRFGDTVVLLGKNGTGKTTFLELLRGALEPTAGQLKIGNDLKIQYVDQHNSIDGAMSPLEHFREIGLEEQQARSVLDSLLFSQQEAVTAVSNLSNGQLLRLRFSLIFRANPDWLILDEPTNNLDPTTWDLLVSLVNEFQGAVLVVSHDRSFIERIENKRIWVLSKRKIKETWGGVEGVLRGM